MARAQARPRPGWTGRKRLGQGGRPRLAGPRRVPRRRGRAWTPRPRTPRPRSPPRTPAGRRGRPSCPRSPSGRSATSSPKASPFVVGLRFGTSSGMLFKREFYPRTWVGLSFLGCSRGTKGVPKKGVLNIGQHEGLNV